MKKTRIVSLFPDDVSRPTWREQMMVCSESTRHAERMRNIDRRRDETNSRGDSVQTGSIDLSVGS